MDHLDGLPRPDVDVAWAERTALDLFGLAGTATELGSQQDRNFLVSADDRRYLLKVNNPVFERAEIEAQNAVMAALASAGLTVPLPQPSLEGSPVSSVEIDGVAHHVRILSFLEGSPLIDAGYLSDKVMRQLGTLAGRVSQALESVTDPGLERWLQWDLRRGEQVVARLLPHVQDAARRHAIESALQEVRERLAPRASALPVQAVHGDLTDDNVVFSRDAAGRPVLDGIIDFGDASQGWRVAELVVACSAVFHHSPYRPLAVLSVIEAFDAIQPLEDAEIDAIWPLLVLRGAVLVVSGAQQVAIDPDNEYASSADDREWQMFAVPAAFDADVATEWIRVRLGRTARRAAAPVVGWLVPSFDGPLIDLSYASRELQEGSWLADATGEERRILAAAAAASGAAATRFAEPRLTRSRINDTAEPVNASLAIDVVLPAGTELLAPFDGELRPLGEAALLMGETASVLIAGLSRPLWGRVVGGSPMGMTSDTVTLWLATGGIRRMPPRFVRPTELDAWLTRYRDPAPLLGLSSTRHTRPDTATALARRDSAYDPLQAHYYARPPLIERGWREHLIDVDGRHYLDMVNNVATLGHGHPRIAEAAADQWRMLNTNSRFHYAAVAEFSERLLATLPDGFDSVLLVNSGTEAVDLALRLTKAFSGREDVMCLSESYHGWSLAADAVSTSLSDNPCADETRLDWVHVAPTPNAYRGAHRGEGAGAAYASDAIAQLRRAADAGRPIGTFIAEPRQGNAGAIEVPAGYFASVYDAVRRGGGVVISDEVQVGYGRQGDVFWGFQQHDGIVPDVITVAKAMGNGHPLGAVITRREIADALASQGTFFSSAGGSTLSSRIGITVLDVMADEGLQGNAAGIGARLRTRLESLAERHPLIGAVHGRGLYMGVELVRDRTTLEPATEETAAICDRFLELGVVVQPTGDRQNVLKVKPPLCISEASADFFVDVLEEILVSGW